MTRLYELCGEELPFVTVSAIYPYWQGRATCNLAKGHTQNHALVSPQSLAVPDEQKGGDGA